MCLESLFSNPRGKTQGGRHDSPSEEGILKANKNGSQLKEALFISL